MTHIIIATGRPASGKTTLLKELEMSNDNYHYTNADTISGPIRTKLSQYHSKVQLIDRLFMDTNSLVPLLDAMGKMGHNILTIYNFEDNKAQCLENDKLRPKERRAAVTINKPYYIDFDLLIKEYPSIDIKIIPTAIYKPTEWELFFMSAGVELNYKRVKEDYYGAHYNIKPSWVNKRYIISDYWDTDAQQHYYNDDWNHHWKDDCDQKPLGFKELDDFLSNIPNLTFNQGLEIKKLAEIVTYSVRDYYLRAERHYHCIDAEQLYNKLLDMNLIGEN